MFGLRRPVALAGIATLILLAVAAPIFGLGLFHKGPTTIAVMPIAVAGDDRDADAMAAGVTGRLSDGLARIDNLRIVAPPKDAASPVQATFVVTGELRRDTQGWTLQSRMVRTADREIHAMTSVTVATTDADTSLQQSRLAAGIGHQLARRINTLTQPVAPSAVTDIASSQGQAKVAIEQAIASITRTTRERFGDAQTMLEKALADDPDNIDLGVALAALQLRGIQMVWYSPDDATAAETHAGKILERALKAKPDSIPVLETYCRFLSATNNFVESLVACARVLSFDPWNGLALYLIGLGQIQSRPLRRRARDIQAGGSLRHAAGLALDVAPWRRMGQPADAPRRRCAALAATLDRDHAGNGTHAYAAGRRLSAAGPHRGAKAAMKKGLELRPGTTAPTCAADQEREPALSRGERWAHPRHGRSRLAGAVSVNKKGGPRGRPFRLSRRDVLTASRRRL